MISLLKRILRKILGLNPPDQVGILVKRGLKIGKNFKMLDECIIDDSHCWHIEIGDDVTLAPRVHILAHDASTKMHLNYTKIKDFKIGLKVFLGVDCLILTGVITGNEAVTGAGAAV